MIQSDRRGGIVMKSTDFSKKLTKYLLLLSIIPLFMLSFNNLSVNAKSKKVNLKSKNIVIKGKTLVKYNGKAKTFEVPKNVCRISSKAFVNATNLKKLIIGPKVNDIKEGTLRNAKNLQSVVVSAKNNTYSSIKGLLYDKYGYELYECPNACKNVIISNKCRVINEIAGDMIKKVVLGKNVESYTSEYGVVIGHTPNLQQIEVKTGNTNFFVRDGVLFNNDSSGIVLAKYPSAVLRDEYVIPDDVVDLLECSFGDARVKNIVFPAGIRQITYHPFYNAYTESLTFLGNYSESISYIGTLKHYDFWSGLSLRDNNLKKYIFKDDNVLLPATNEVYWIKPDMTICSRKNSTAHRYAIDNNLQWCEYVD